MFVPHGSEIWTKSYGRNYTKFWAFWKKNRFFKIIFWKSADAILEDVSVAETILQYWFPDYDLSVFQK